MLNTSDQYEQNNTDAPNTSTAIPEQEKYDKRLILFGSAILLFVIAVGVYFFTVNNKPSSPESPSSISDNPIPTTDTDSTQSSNSTNYSNTVGGFTFEYPNSLVIQWDGLSENPENASLLYLSPAEEIGSDGMRIEIVNNPTNQAYDSEEALVSEVVNYHTSSTAHYFYPENNTLTTIETEDGSYVYEVAWENNSEEDLESTGTDIIRVYPLDSVSYPVTGEQSSNVRVLLIKYPKEQTVLYDPVVSSLRISADGN